MSYTMKQTREEREYGHPCGRPRGVFYRIAEV